MASTRNFSRKKLLALHFSETDCVGFRNSSFKKLLISRYLPRFLLGCSLFSASSSRSSASSSLSTVQQQQLVTSPHAAYHPRASGCFFSSRLQHFHCSASQLQRRQHAHSDSRAATFRDRKRTAVPPLTLTRTIVQNNTSAMLLQKLRQRRWKKLNRRK